MAQAKKRNDWPMFEKEIQEEYQQMFDDKVYTNKSVKYSDLPKDANLLGTMFTLTVKRNPSTGEIEKYKALCDQLAYAMEMHGAPFLHHELRYNEALEAWRAMK